MLKFVLPNKTKHSFDYNSEDSIKEIFKSFCAKKGLLADIYEVYDPKKSIEINEDKSPKYYKLKKIYIRRVTEPRSSTDDCLERSINYQQDQFLPSPGLSSQNKNSFTFNNKKNEKSKKSKKLGENHKTQKQKAYSNSVSAVYPTTEKKTVNLTFTDDKIYTELVLNSDIKKKRRAPECPMVNDDGSVDLSRSPDIEIPSPPTYTDLQYNEIQYCPWLTDISCGADAYSESEDSTYASLFENLSPDDLLITLDKAINTHLPVEMKTYGIVEETNEDCENTTENSVILQGKRLNSDEIVSDSEDHVYSIIAKKTPTTNNIDVDIANLSKNNLIFQEKEQMFDENLFDPDGHVYSFITYTTSAKNNIDIDIADVSKNYDTVDERRSVSEIDNLKTSFDLNPVKENTKLWKEHENNHIDKKMEIDSADSETSSIGSQSIPVVKFATIKPKNDKPKPLSAKSNAIIQEYQSVTNSKDEGLTCASPKPSILKEKPLSYKDRQQYRPPILAVKPQEIHF